MLLAGRDVSVALPGGQARDLLAFLVLRRRRPVHRQELVAALWPEHPPPGADSALSALLSRLRRVLGDQMLRGRGEVTLELPSDAEVDLEVALAAIHRAQSAVLQERWTDGWGPSLVALATARRGFLPAQGAPWADEVRTRLDDLRCAALECFAAVALGVGGGELPVGERAARELVASVPYRERGYALLMQLLEARGSHAEALIVFEEVRGRLRDDLGTAPGPQLRALQVHLLRAGV